MKVIFNVAERKGKAYFQKRYPAHIRKYIKPDSCYKSYKAKDKSEREEKLLQLASKYNRAIGIIENIVDSNNAVLKEVKANLVKLSWVDDLFEKSLLNSELLNKEIKNINIYSSLFKSSDYEDKMLMLEAVRRLYFDYGLETSYDYTSDKKDYFIEVEKIISQLKTFLALITKVEESFDRLKSMTDGQLLSIDSNSLDVYNKLDIRNLISTVHNNNIKLTAVKDNRIKVSDAYDIWKESNPKTKKSISEWKLATIRFIEIIGDKEVNDITKSDVNKYIKVISKLPVYKKLPKELKKKTAQEIVKLTQEGFFESFDLFTQSSIRKQINAMHAIIEVSINRFDGLVERNPFSKIKISEKSEDVDVNIKLSYTKSELELIFNDKWFLNVSPADRDKNFWMPLIALYTGARLIEICRLTKSAIIYDDEIPHFIFYHFKGGNKKAKIRKVPIHSELIKIGIVDFVKSCEDEYIFAGSENRVQLCDSKFSDAWGLFSDSIGVHERGNGRKPFHKFRHTVKDSMVECGIDSRVNDLITGHTASKNVGSQYGDGYTLNRINQIYQKTDLWSLDLSHLYPENYKNEFKRKKLKKKDKKASSKS